MTPPPPFARLSDRALIRLGGADWRPFLQGLITQEVETLGDGEVRYAALLTPQGRVLHDLFVLAEGEGALLDVAAQTRDALVARLTLYRLRAKVEIAPAEGAVVALFGDAAPWEPGWRRDPRLAALGWRGVDLEPPAGAATADEAAYERLRIGHGVGDMLRDGLAERDYALDANLDLLNAVDFAKGCFVGQETTSRMKRRSGAKSRLVTIRFDGPPPASGAEVLVETAAGGLRAGEVRSGVEGAALALLRLDRAESGALSVEGRAVRFDPPEWLSAFLAQTGPTDAAAAVANA